MKHFKNLSLLLLCTVMSLSFTACSKDDEPKFDYDINQIVGTWVVTDVNLGSDYVSWFMERTSATFNANGTYSGRGYFGYGNGTYKAEGKTIITYIGGKEYLRYDVIRLSGNTCELRMYQTGSDADIMLKCRKE